MFGLGNVQNTCLRMQLWLSAFNERFQLTFELARLTKLLCCEALPRWVRGRLVLPSGNLNSISIHKKNMKKRTLTSRLGSKPYNYILSIQCALNFCHAARKSYIPTLLVFKQNPAKISTCCVKHFTSLRLALSGGKLQPLPGVQFIWVRWEKQWRGWQE